MFSELGTVYSVHRLSLAIGSVGVCLDSGWICDPENLSDGCFLMICEG